MTTFNKNYGHGAFSDESFGTSQPSLGQTLTDIASDLDAVDPGAPAWSAAAAVTTHTVTLTTAGLVTNVFASTGTSVGPKQLVPTGTPAAGQARVTYAATGLPTILFAAADAVTACQVQQLARPASYTLKTVAG